MWPLAQSAEGAKRRRRAFAVLPGLTFAGAVAASAPVPAQTYDVEGGNYMITSLSGGGIVTNSGPGPGTLTNGGPSSTFSGVIQDGVAATALTQDSIVGGTLTLTGNNSYSGGTAIQAGSISITNGSALGAGNVEFTGSGALEGNFSGTLANDVFVPLGVSATIGAGSGKTLTVGGAFFAEGGTGTTLHFGAAADTGTVNLASAGAGFFPGGAASVDGGTLKIGSLLAVVLVSDFTGLTVGSGSTPAKLDLAGNWTTVNGLTGNANGVITNSGTSAATLTNQGPSSTFSGLIQDGASAIGLTLNSPGNTLTLAGANTYSGPTTVQAGTLMSAATNAFSAASATTVNAGGVLDLGGFNQTVSLLAGGGTVTNSGPSGATLTVNNTVSTTFAGVIQDGFGGQTRLAVQGPGALILTGANSYTGATTIATGSTLQIGAGGTSGSIDASGLPAGPLTNNGALVFDRSDASVFYGTISGAGSLTVTGGGTLTLAANASYTGPTMVANGTLLGGPGFLSPNSVTTIDTGGVLDLFSPQTINTVLLAGGVIERGLLGGTITSTGGTVDGLSSAALVVDSGVTTLKTTTGLNQFFEITVNGGTFLFGAANAFSDNGNLRINGGTVNLGGFWEALFPFTLAGGTIENGAITNLAPVPIAVITSTGGTVDGIGGTTALTVNSGVPTLKTTTGPNAYSGATTINGGTLIGGAANAFSANSPTMVNSGGTLDLGGFVQTINSVNLAGGIIQNGALTSVNGITSSGGTLNQMTVSTSGTDGHALQVAGSSAQLNLVGTNTFTTQAAGAIGLYASLGGVISATGATNITTSASGAYGVNADGAGAQIKLGSANVATAGTGAFGLFTSDASASGGAGSISTTGTLNVTTTNPAAAAIGLQGNGASILATGGGMIASAGDAIEFLGGTNQTATFDSFDISTQSGDIVFADPSIATIAFNNSTVDAGTGHLLNATGGSVITFNANASTLTGAMATDPTSTSNVSLTNGTTWNLTGPSNVSSLAVTNSAIVFAPPGSGGFKTLTVGNYVGSGANITLNTALGGSSSPTDQIVVSGGTATGLTYLTIRNAGGLGAQTTGSGIPVVVTTNGGTTAPNAFALANPSLVVGDYRYSLVDPSGDWYLVSQPTPTLQQVQSSVNAVAKAQQNQIVINRVLGSILLGATEQISCSSCGSGFGSIGSLGLGAHGRLGLSDQLTAMGGVSYNQSSSDGISVYDAPTVAGSLVYDFSNLGDSRPFVEAGGGFTPYEQVKYSRNYANGYGTALGTATAVNRALSLFARVGWVARLSPTDEAAISGDLSRSWMQTGGYSEATTTINPYPATVAPGLDTLNVARIGGQYTHLFNGNIETNVSAGVAYGFGAGSGSVVNVYDFGPIAPNALPNTTWFEYGARIGYRASDSLVVDAFVIGTAGGAVGATAHGGIALRVAF
jgi:fibronectin-binding autotransporter adhesin